MKKQELLHLNGLLHMLGETIQDEQHLFNESPWTGQYTPPTAINESKTSHYDAVRGRAEDIVTYTGRAEQVSSGVAAYFERLHDMDADALLVTYDLSEEDEYYSEAEPVPSLD